MAENSKIEWTDHTFNPWMGCTKVHAGCANCYAENLMDTRWGKVEWGPTGTRVVAVESAWKKPLKWNKDAEKAGVRARVFCASLADIFEDWTGELINARGETLYYLPDGKFHSLQPGQFFLNSRQPMTMHDVRRRVFSLIDQTPWLDWLILTKRPENVVRMWDYPAGSPMPGFAGGYRSNVYLLTSVSSQPSVDKQLPELAKCRHLVPVLGISAEPLLEDIDISGYLGLEEDRDGSWRRESKWGGATRILDWVIVGGESGHGARPFDVRWARTLRDQCKTAEVACFIKQLGAISVDSDFSEEDGTPSLIVGLKDKKGGDWSEWPEGLKVRQFPFFSPPHLPLVTPA